MVELQMSGTILTISVVVTKGWAVLWCLTWVTSLGLFYMYLAGLNCEVGSWTQKKEYDMSMTCFVVSCFTFSIFPPSTLCPSSFDGCDAAEATGLGFVCFGVLNPCVSTNRVYFGVFCFINFPILLLPPPSPGKASCRTWKTSRSNWKRDL